MRGTGRAIGILALLTLLCGADYYEGLAAFDRGDYAAALREWGPLARDGDSEAQYRVARLYRHGQGVDQDDALAAEWYGRAAEQGHAISQNNLGALYEDGRGVEQDSAEAVRWYRRAAEQGRSVGQFNLARLLDSGAGIAEDPRQAATWYRAAGEQGHVASQLRLAEMFETGHGVVADEAGAARWYRRAAREGDPIGQFRTGQRFAAGQGLPQNPKKAARWLQLAAEQGVAEALEELDKIYDRGPPISTAAPASPPAERAAAPAAPLVEPVGRAAPPAEAASPPPDFPTALRELQPGAEAGDAEAQYLLGRAYAQGQGVARNGERAEYWFESAASQDHGRASYQLAFLHLRGRGSSGRKDFGRAWAFMSVAADLGIGDAAKWRDRIEADLTDEEQAEGDRILTDRSAAP